MNTAIAITAIIAAVAVINSAITAARDTAKAKHQAAAVRVRVLHRKATHGDDCVHCAAFGPGYDNTWPCETIRVLDGNTASKENEA